MTKKKGPLRTLVKPLWPFLRLEVDVKVEEKRNVFIYYARYGAIICHLVHYLWL